MVPLPSLWEKSFASDPGTFGTSTCPQITRKAPAGHGVGIVVISDTPPFPRSAKEGFII